MPDPLVPSTEALPLADTTGANVYEWCDADAYLLAKRIVRAHLTAFFELGAALLTIRDNRWYRADGYATFEAFCESEFGVSRPRAYELIGAAQVLGNLSAIADTGTDGNALPTNESQVRPLTRIDAADQPIVWQSAQGAAHAEGKPVAAHHVAAAVSALRTSRAPSRDDAALLAEPVFVWRNYSRLIYPFRDLSGGERTTFAEIEATAGRGGEPRYVSTIGGKHYGTDTDKAAAMHRVEGYARAVAGYAPTTRTTGDSDTGGTTE